MKTKLECKSCKISYDIDYEEFYTKMVELRVKRKDIFCPKCGKLVTTLKQVEDQIELPLLSAEALAKADKDEVDKMQILYAASRNIEERLKQEQYICPSCHKPSGWYKDTRHLTVPEGCIYHHACIHCQASVTTTYGSRVLKEKTKNLQKLDLGYSGAEKYKKPREINIEPVPLLDWSE